MRLFNDVFLCQVASEFVDDAAAAVRPSMAVMAVVGTWTWTDMAEVVVDGGGGAVTVVGE